MWLPSNDPFVIFGIALLLSSIVLAIILLTCISYKSANEVWGTAEQKTNWRQQKVPVDEEKGAEVDDEEQAPPSKPESAVKNESSVKRAVSKFVRFSSRAQRHAPVPQNDDDEIVGGDIAYAGRGMSWNQQQTTELHFV